MLERVGWFILFAGVAALQAIFIWDILRTLTNEICVV